MSGDCVNNVRWIKDVFGECVITPKDKWSFGFGLFSSLVWIVCSSPQIIQNFVTKRVEGISPYFFSLLFFGTILSLIGILVTGGLVTQYITAVLFCLLDGILYVQYFYYTAKNKKKAEEILDNTDPNRSLHLAAVVGAAAASIDFGEKYRGSTLVGTVFGWVGSCIYIGSRIPQIVKNFQDKKVKDLSPFYVFLSILGNGTYCLSVFIKDITGQYLWNQLPWIVGAAGPMICDITFVIQMWVFGLDINKPLDKNEDIREEEEEGNKLEEL